MPFRVGPTNFPFRQAVQVVIANEVITAGQCGEPPPAIQCQETVPGHMTCDVTITRIGHPLGLNVPLIVSAYYTTALQSMSGLDFAGLLAAPRYGTLAAIGDEVSFSLDQDIFAIQAPPRGIVPDFVLEVWYATTPNFDGATYPQGSNITAWRRPECF